MKPKHGEVSLTLTYKWTDEDILEVEEYSSNAAVDKRIAELRKLENPREGRRVINIKIIPGICQSCED